MDDKGRFYSNPTPEEVKDKKLIELSEEEYKAMAMAEKKERKDFYRQKMGLKKSSPWGKNYFNKVGSK